MFKRSLQIMLVVLMGAVFGVVSTQGASAASTSVYSQPGDHAVNGRHWKTNCEMYSKTVVRCTTDIWATKVVKHNGAYYNHNGWVFNNLTYLPSIRSSWKSNELAVAGSWTAKDGRQWKTECDTPATGKNGCRSYIKATQVVKSGSTFVSQTDWVFNNIVQFSSAATPAQATIPPKTPALANMPVEKKFTPPAASGGASSGKLDLSRAAMWDRIARCESTNNWSINTGNGHYGGLQFNLQTWRSVGGLEFASYPHKASRAEQITVANRLYAKRGTQPWSCA